MLVAPEPILFCLKYANNWQIVVECSRKQWSILCNECKSHKRFCLCSQSVKNCDVTHLSISSSILLDSVHAQQQHIRFGRHDQLSSCQCLSLLWQCAYMQRPATASTRAAAYLDAFPAKGARTKIVQLIRSFTNPFACRQVSTEGTSMAVLWAVRREWSHAWSLNQ